VLALLLAGIGVAYKLTLVPFHFYAPDVYQGAPPLGVAAVSVLPKIGAAAALVRFLSLAVSPAALPAASVAHLLAWLAAASALFAAVTAVVQRDAKRILAFSGIGHGAAVLLAAACGPGRDAAAAVGFYLLTYAAANVGAFVCLSVLERERGGSALDSLAGAARQRPWVAGALCVFVASLAGVPPLAGFLGKWAVLQQALARGLAADGSPALGVAALLFLLASAVSAWAYLLIVRAVVLAPSPRDSCAATSVPAPTTAVLAVCAAATFVGGVWLNGLTALRAWL
jgi:NADH-quinone oxidoreductase subunit N